MPGRNDFSVVYQMRRKGHTILRVHKYDPGANLIDSMVIKDYGERLFNTPVLDLIRSEDRNCMVVYNTAERDQMEACCFLLDKMQLLWDTSTVVDDAADLFDSHQPEMALSNAGAFFWVNVSEQPRSSAFFARPMILKYLPFQPSPGSFSPITTPMSSVKMECPG